MNIKIIPVKLSTEYPEKTIEHKVGDLVNFTTKNNLTNTGFHTGFNLEDMDHLAVISEISANDIYEVIIPTIGKKYIPVKDLVFQ